MVTKQDIETAFGTYKTDKLIHGYASVYSVVFQESIKSVLEIGVHRGRSLLAWHELLPEATIVGLDIDIAPVGFYPPSRIMLVQADVRSFDPSALPNFDLIVDDCTHEPEDIQNLIGKFSRKAMKAYVIEDLYPSRISAVWNRVVADFPNDEVSLWRTSNYSGDLRCPEGDSQCILLRRKNDL